MNKVALSAQEFPLPKWAGNLKKYTRNVLNVLGKDKWDISVLLCGDKTISSLNSSYRKKPGATDILSFSLDEGEKFPCCGSGKHGEIIISLESMRSNAKRYKISVDEELRRLLIHGILHLDGMDHSGSLEQEDSIEPGKKPEPMLYLQEEVLAQLSNEHIIGKDVL